MQKLLYLFIGISISLLLISAALSSIKKPDDKDAQKTSNETPKPTEVKPEGSVTEIQITGSEYSFSPSSFEVNKGDLVSLTFRNVGQMPHNLVIKELGVATKTIMRGQSDTVEFTATEAGVLRYYCSIGSHATLGMEGSLEVK
jgi:plastocyanin